MATPIQEADNMDEETSTRELTLVSRGSLRGSIVMEHNTQVEPGHNQVMGMQQELQRHRFLRTPKMRQILHEFSCGLGQSKRRTVLKDFVVLCTASLFGALGSLPLHTLQTTINCPPSLGYFALSLLYASFALAIGCAGLITRCIQLSPKIILLGAMTSQVIFISANNYPSYSILLPASVLSGLGHGILWHAQITLVSSLALKYSALSYGSNNFYGRTFRAIFVLTYEVAFIVGNLYSSIIFFNFTNRDSNVITRNETDSVSTFISWNNFTGTNNTQSNESTSTNETLCLTWHSDVFNCDPSMGWLENFKMLFSTYSVFIVTGFLIILIFLNSPDVVLQTSPSSESLWSQTKSTWKSCRFSIVFCCCFTGIQQAFVFGDITKFIGTNLGLPMVGVGMAFYGLSRLPWLLVANSRLQETIARRKKVWILGLLCYFMTMLAYILTGVFISVQSVGLLQFLMPIWGIMEGLNEQVISGLYHKTSPGAVVGMMYPCLHSAGMAIGSAIGPFICPMIRIQAQLTVLTITLLGAAVISPCLQKGPTEQPTDV